jgi:hypothetical protein
MRRLAGIVVLLALATGCIGSTSSSTSNGRSSDDLGLIALKTALTIRYSVPTCPPSAHCLTTQEGFHIVSRQLLCSPDGGDYDDPAAACRALTDLVTKLHEPGRAVCACPLMIRPLAKAVGFYHGKRRTIPLDGCSLCGLRGIGGDLKLLMP